MPRCIAISINTAWNLANFRTGLIRAIQAEGWNVLAIAPPDQHVERIEALGCRFIPVQMNNKGANPFDDAKLFFRYFRIFQRERPSAFLGYTIKPNVYGSLAAHALRIPVINNVSGLGTAFIRDSWLTWVVKGLYRLALRHSHTVFFQNRDDRQLFIEQRLVPLARTALVPGSGIDLLRFTPTTTARTNPGTRFLLIARLLYDKGVGEYVAAARLVKDTHRDATFALLGFLDADNRTAVPREDVQSWEAEGVIEYLGSADDVRPYIAEADCIVLPSYREGTPRTLLEAAAMGKPLIATDVPGCREVVEHGHNGFLCRVRDADNLASALMKFVELSPSGRARMGQAGRAKVEREFDEQLVIAAYINRLRGLLSETAVRETRA
jgi:glycosyltransferase involved in cell wall biosynthesis